MLSLRLLGTAFVTWTLVLASNGVVEDSNNDHHPVPPDGIGWSLNNASMASLSTHQLLPRQLPRGECDKDTPCIINACCNGKYVRDAASGKLPDIVLTWELLQVWLW